MSPRGSSGGGGGRGSDRGQGGGRGMGRSGRRGMGRGMNRGRGNSHAIWQGIERKIGMEVSISPVEPQYFQPDSEHSGQEGLRSEKPDQEIEMLRIQADTISAQLQSINERISQLQRGEPSMFADVANIKAVRRTSDDVIVGRTAVVVDKEECVSCEICASVCPVGAITIDDVAVINLQKCTGCGLCVDVCPNNAISFAELKEAVS